MASPSQRAANAANAQHSTGPKTDAGKARSSQNARKHGFTAAELYVPDEQREQFEELQAGLLAIIDPTNDLENNLTKHLIAAAWKIERLRFMEAELLSRETNPLLDESIAKALDRVDRYITTAERSYHRTLQELHALQTNRWIAACDETDPILPLLPRLADAAKIKRTRSKQIEAKRDLAVSGPGRPSAVSAPRRN